jgi:AraC family L-rhamnose operon regulatory protein RhaS
MLCLCVAPKGELAALFAPIQPRRFAVARSFPLTHEITPHLRTILYEQSRNAATSSAIVTAHTLLIFSKLSRRGDLNLKEDDCGFSHTEVQLLARVRDYVEKLETNFHDAETIQSAAERLGMSPRSFTDYFRRVAGTTRHQYIQKLRLRQARHLLAYTEESVTSIAFACGFEDLSTFFRAFRIEEKMTPAQWRKNHREGDGQPQST